MTDMTGMNDKQWVVFKYTNDEIRYKDELKMRLYLTPRPPFEERFMIWDEKSHDYSWVSKLERATLFTRKKSKILASMYFAVADLHPKYRYD